MSEKTERLGEEIEEIIHAADLNQKQMDFVLNIISGMTKQNAAKEAGYAKSAAHVQASRLLKNDKIATVIRDCRRTRAKILGSTKLDQLAYYLEQRDDLDEDRANRNHAADKINRLEGHYDDKISVNVTGSLADRMKAARKRKT